MYNKQFGSMQCGLSLLLSTAMFLFALLVACTTTSAVHLPAKPHYDLDDAPNLFREYVQKYGKVYNPEDYSQRLEIFKENLNKINELNAKESLTEFGINRFADLTAEESKRYFGFKLDSSFHERAVKYEVTAEQIRDLPHKFDWRDHNAVTRVKDQEACGSCWIFSGVGNIEGIYAIKYNKTIEFSEKQMLDCVHPYSSISDNCQGGYPHQVMYHAAVRGVIPEKVYFPYTSAQEDCRENSTDVVTYVDSFSIYVPSEDGLQKLLVETGPLSVSLAANAVLTYKGGILLAKDCDSEVNHGVVLVGYGEEKGVKYWTIKNSWSEDWGEKGYFRLERGANACLMGTSYTATCTLT